MSGVMVWCELVCSQCSDTSEGHFSSEGLRKRQLITKAKARGWIVEDGEVFCSRHCRAAWADPISTNDYRDRPAQPSPTAQGDQ